MLYANYQSAYDQMCKVRDQNKKASTRVTPRYYASLLHPLFKTNEWQYIAIHGGGPGSGHAYSATPKAQALLAAKTRLYAENRTHVARMNVFDEITLQEERKKKVLEAMERWALWVGGGGRYDEEN